MRILKTDRLYCFSPPIMIITFLLEMIFAVYVLYRYKLTPVSRIAVAILIALATFQFAEYNVCVGGWGVDSLTWARVGYVAITLLPPLGLHLAMVIAGKKQPWLIVAAYASAAVFTWIFLFVGHGMTGEQCLGNYVIFSIAPWAVWPYTIYYYGWLLFTVGYSLLAASHLAGAKGGALVALAVGYMSFILPTTAVNIIDPTTLSGVPSIMCGFAVILALILTIKVVPLAHQESKQSHGKRT